MVAAGVVLVLAQLAFRGWALSGSYFYFDDLAFMSRAMNDDFGWDYLMESYGGHLMPGGFALAWILTDWAPYGWATWAAVLLALQALAGFGMLRLLLSLFGRRPFVLALLAGYLAYVFTLPAGLWWAAGINQLPLQVALVFGLHAFLAHLRTRRLLPLATSVLWTLAGLAFYEKTVLLIGIYALVALGWFGSGKTPDRLRSIWDRYRVAVVTYTLLGAGYVAAYAELGLNFGPTDTSQPWWPIADNLVLTALASAVVGGPIRWEPLSVGSFADPTQLVLTISWVAIAGLAVYAYRTRTLSKRAWAPLGFALLANVALLASARANLVGPDIAREYRYQTESAALLVLGIGLAFLPVLDAPEQNQPRPDVPRTYDDRRLVAAVTALVVAAATYSSVRYVDLWQERNPTEADVAAVERGLAEAPQSPTPLVDAAIPDTMLWGYRFPENTLSHVFRNLADRTEYPRVAVDNLYVVDGAGDLSPVTVTTIRSMVPADGCGYPVDDSGDVTIPLDGPVIGGGWWVRIGYASDTDVTVRIVAGLVDRRIELPEGIHNVYLAVEGDFSSILLVNADAVDEDGPSDPGVCFTDLSLGYAVPTVVDAS